MDFIKGYESAHMDRAYSSIIYGFFKYPLTATEKNPLIISKVLRLWWSFRRVLLEN